MQPIQNTATVTSKGQITLPKFVRQTLGVDTGSKLAFTLQDGAIVVSRADTARHTDPAITGFLHMLEQDISHGRQIAALPSELLEAMRAAVSRDDAESVEIDGEVCL